MLIINLQLLNVGMNMKKSLGETLIFEIQLQINVKGCHDFQRYS